MIPTFIRAYEASAIIAGFRLVAFSDVASSSKIAQGAANTDPVMGVSDGMGAEIGDMCDVHRGGTVSVELGGPVSAGDPITADADGKGILAVATTATTVRIVGFADEPGIAGDIVDVFFAPGTLHEA